MTKKTHSALLSALAVVSFGLIAPVVSSGAVVFTVFTEDFESSPTTTFQAGGGNALSNWIGATNGYGSSRRGIWNENHANTYTYIDTGATFSTADGEKAWVGAYTNSGLTTADGAVVTVAASQSYTLTFDVMADSSGPASYRAELRVFEPGDSRIYANGGIQGNEVSFLSGTVATGTAETHSITFNTGPTNPYIGRDLAIVLFGNNSDPIYDNISVSYVKFVPEPTTSAMAFFGLILLRGLKNRGGRRSTT